MPRPILLASLGNPPPHQQTFHSAGHILLSAIQTHLSSLPNPHLKTHISPSLMNISGPALLKTYKHYLHSLPPPFRRTAKLVILHDELELPLGRISRPKSGGSAKGHNGIKSCTAALGSTGFVRIGVGIGRPESRERGDVAAYVLGKMGPGQVKVVRGLVEEVVRVVQGIMAEGEEEGEE